MFRLVIDSSALVPCGNKSDEDIESIKRFGNSLPEIASRFGVLLVLTQSILGEYFSRAMPKMEQCKGSLPKFHASFSRTLTLNSRLLKQLKKCVLREGLLKNIDVHVLETSRVEIYDVDEFVADKDDTKFVKAALAVASNGVVYIVTVDQHLLVLAEDWNYERFCRRFEYGSNVKVVKPGVFVDIVESSEEVR